ncbi:uncharacterized protein Nmag_1324 [Natrialba magadii ATCC 43099]|uniref:DUF5305 domain-containing protein n=1 Tax=Natrialba magadii (strain ATCC 43099 / DSM 3394 / CCM 3739 / CIP 104546 / IAM 13178 / JCM 8861 / NBRC 102185 / NCIMB 2190 / MS3) TaxID=547559 RepID=D3SSV7_NATMM|nr:DUF5305 family protein [Natrialba magadii]ADD04903.1 uncharacterized protein Nmag_1324 [Natrialba magadii ATCC 43099]ELY23952.1 hypothetical protein C500_19140 [Natrialba magadii ATCC 43099]
MSIWEYRVVLYLVAVVLLGIGIWLSYGAYAAPGAETEQQLVTDWTATGEISHTAVVEEATTVHDEGVELTDEPLYYTAVTPTATGAFTAGYDPAPETTATDVDVTVTVDLVYRETTGGGSESGTSETATDDGIYWSEREQLTSVSEADVGPDDDVTASFELNVTDAQLTLESIRDEMGATPGEAELVLVFEREIEGTFDGTPQVVVDHYQVPVAVAADGSTYQFETDAETGAYAERHDEYEPVTVPAEPSTTQAAGGPLLIALGLAGLAGTALASRRLPELTPEDQTRLEYLDARAEFEPMTTRVTLPDEAVTGPTAAVETLATLADLAIDLESPLVFDERTGWYLVRGSDVVYVFEPPRAGVLAVDGERGLDRMQDRGREQTQQVQELGQGQAQVQEEHGSGDRDEDEDGGGNGNEDKDKAEAKAKDTLEWVDETNGRNTMTSGSDSGAETDTESTANDATPSSTTQ